MSDAISKARDDLIKRLESYIPGPGGHGSQFAHDITEALESLKAEQALRGEAVAWVRITDGKVTHVDVHKYPGYLPLYTHPQTESQARVPEGYVMVPIRKLQELMLHARENEDDDLYDYFIRLVESTNRGNS